MVDVPDTIELDAAVTYITHLQRCRRRQLLLDVQVPGHYIGCAQVPRNTEDVARSAPGHRIAVDRGLEDRPCNRPVQQVAGQVDGGSCNRPVRAGDSRGSRRRNHVQPCSRGIFHAVLSQEQRQVRNLIGHAATGADHRLAAPPRIPGDAQTRREVVVVAVVRRTDSMAHLLDADRGVKIGQPVLALLDDRIQVIAHTSINSQPWSDAPVIL